MQHHLPGFAVAFGRDSAGIDDKNIGMILFRYDFITVTDQILPHQLGFILINLAAQGIKSCAQ